MTEDTEKKPLAQQAAPEQAHHHHHHDHPHHHGAHGGKGGKCLRHKFAPDSLTGLVFQLGHKLHHSDESDLEDEKLFAALSPEEKTELQQILAKLVASWKKPEESTDATAENK